MRLTKNQMVFVLAVVIVNAVLWIVPSDVVELVARDRHTLLGRYSRRHFAWIIALVPISAVATYIHLSATAAIKKRRTLKVLAALLVLVPSVLAGDVFLRLRRDWNYVLDKAAYCRAAGISLRGRFVDAPEAARTYPDAPPGFGIIEWTLTTDTRGFRNPTSRGHYDVLALGDSFTEGSEVSDEHPWPVRFTALTGVSCCNLGMSGYAPQNSLAALMEHGPTLKPRSVFYLLYEGNDFKRAKVTSKPRPQWSRFFKRSPLINAVDQFMIQTLGPIGAQRHLDELELLSWLPLAVPEGPDARYYAISPEMLVDHFVSRSQFEPSKQWSGTRDNLEAMAKFCKENGFGFTVVYAPTKAHVVLPLVRADLPPDKVRAFVGLRSKFNLPPAETFINDLLSYLDVKEAVTQAWCKSRDVSFLSLTESLRDAARQGRQVYLTYNDHWSPTGHEVAAERIARFWRNCTQTEPRPWGPGMPRGAERHEANQHEADEFFGITGTPRSQ